MKSKLLALAFGMAVSVSATAVPTFTLTAPVGWDGSFSIKIAGFEAFTGPLAVGAENFGVLRVTSILDGGGNNTLWTNGQGGAEITGVFSKILTATVAPFGIGSASVTSTGGLGSFFINPVGSLTAAGGGLGFAQGLGGYAAAGGGCAANMNCYNGISNVVGGGSFIDVAWVGGVADLLGDFTTTVSGVFLAATTPQSGFAAGFVDVVGGPSAGLFQKDVFSFTNNSPADLRVNNTFCTPGEVGCAASVASAGGAPAAGGWALRIDDPINGAFKVPEPGSLALVGLGLLGVAAIRRRKV